MPLIDLQTNLKALTYGGNGPYVQKDIDNPGRPASGQIQARIDDTLRITRMLLDKGPTFAAKQALLLAGKEGFNAIPQTVRILANIIAQVPVNGTGTHFLPSGRGHFYTGVDNAASNALYSGIVGGTSRTGRAFNIPTRLLSRASQLGTITDNANGPIVGDVTDLILNPNSEYVKPTSAVLTVQGNNFKTKGEKNAPIQIQKFNNRESLETGYGFGQVGTVDLINATEIFTSQAQADADPAKDLVPFTFKILKISSQGALEDVSVIKVRPFITSFSDNNTGTWNGTSYVGRGENFYVFQNHSRSLGFSFRLAAFSKEELIPIYEKANLLISTTAPSYSSAGLMRGTVVKLTFGNYLVDTPVIMNSVNVNVETDVPWDTEDGRILPTVLTVSVQATVLHSFTPQTVVSPGATTQDGNINKYINY